MNEQARVMRENIEADLDTIENRYNRGQLDARDAFRWLFEIEYDLDNPRSPIRPGMRTYREFSRRIAELRSMVAPKRYNHVIRCPLRHISAIDAGMYDG